MAVSPGPVRERPGDSPPALDTREEAAEKPNQPTIKTPAYDFKTCPSGRLHSDACGGPQAPRAGLVEQQGRRERVLISTCFGVCRSSLHYLHHQPERRRNLGECICPRLRPLRCFLFPELPQRSGLQTTR